MDYLNLISSFQASQIEEKPFFVDCQLIEHHVALLSPFTTWLLRCSVVFLFACKNLKISRHSLFLSNKSNVLESSMNNVTPEKGMFKKGKFLVIFQSLDLVFICQVMCCQLIKFLKVPSLFRIFLKPILSFL